MSLTPIIGLESLDTYERTVISKMADICASKLLVGVSELLWNNGSWQAFSNNCIATLRSANKHLQGKN